MRTRLHKLTVTAVVGATLPLLLAAPASAKGCPATGAIWSGWAQLGPDYKDPVGEWTADAARTKDPKGDDYRHLGDDNPAVISHVISMYCE